MKPEIKVTIGDTELTVKPLTLRALRQLSADGHLKALAEGDAMTAGRIDAMVAVIAAAIQRTHKQVDAEWLLDNVEQQDLAHLFEICVDVSGFLKRNGDPKTESP